MTDELGIGTRAIQAGHDLDPTPRTIMAPAARPKIYVQGGAATEARTVAFRHAALRPYGPPRGQRAGGPASAVAR